jgi:hypothetical protein
MSITGEKRALFSVYERAVAGELIFLFFFLCGVLSMILGHKAGATFALFALGFIVAVAAYYAARCPTCRKSPWTRHRASGDSGWRNILAARRAWPERRCSGCETQLDASS